MNDIAKEAEQKAKSLTDLAMREASILGARAPFIVWGMLFGSITWILFFGIKTGKGE